MPRRFMSRDFWREKWNSLSSNQHEQGDTSLYSTIEEEEENHQSQSSEESEDDTGQNENNRGPAKEPLPIPSDGTYRDATKTVVQELLKTAFRNLERQNLALMKKFKELMMAELSGTTPTTLNVQDDWDIMEVFISRQTVGALHSKQIKLYSGLDQAFRILKGIIEMINEPIKFVPQAAVPWAGMSIAVTLISQPVTERKASLDGSQAILGKLRWYQGLAGYLFQDHEDGRSISRQRNLLRDKMIDYFQKLLLYQIRSILLLHTNNILATFRGAAKLDEWELYTKEIQTVETELDNRIEQFEKRKEREEQSQLQTDNIRNACLNVLGVSNPKYDRKRILRDKGGLVPSCCDWIRPQQASGQGIFLDWLNNSDQTIFWITETNYNRPLFYFFCEISQSQTIDYNAAAIRDLIYAIVSENKQLTRYIQAEWDKNNNLFKDANVQLTSYEILKAILADDLLKSAIIFVDALDECGADLDLLFEIIKSSPNIKWVISSRSNTTFVDEKLLNVPRCRNTSLDDLGDVVSEAVTLYIRKQVQDLRQVKRYEDGISREIERYLTTHSEGKFLWAALACKELWDPDTDDHEALEVLKRLPRGLDSMYDTMMQKCQTANQERRKLFEVILSINLVVSRSITLDEFLRLMENVPLPGIHYDIFERCVNQMRNYLRRDMLLLKHPAAVVPKEHPGFNRLNSIAYACTSWVEHIKCALTREFLCKHFLHWIEALSLLGKLSVGALALYNIEKFTTGFHLEGRYSQAITFSSDGKLLAMHSGSEVWIWDIFSRTVICKIYDWRQGPQSMDFSPDGRFLALDLDSRCTKVRDINDTKLELMKTTERSLDTNMKASRIELWDRIGASACVLASKKAVVVVAFSWDGKKLAFAACDGSFVVVDIARELCKENAFCPILCSETDTGTTKLEFSRDDSLLAIMQDYSIWFFDVETGQSCKLSSEFRRFHDVKFYDNQLAVSITETGHIQMWNPVTGFGQNNSTIIYSDCGAVDLGQFDLSVNQITSREERVIYQGYGSRGPWLMKDDRPIIWIPREYRGFEQCAIGKSQIALVYRSEHLLLLDFTEENIQFCYNHLSVFQCARNKRQTSFLPLIPRFCIFDRKCCQMRYRSAGSLVCIGASQNLLYLDNPKR
ncbi:hypothetical protein ACQKWADRAFT_319600 [Trichoderma austrokoningii]